VSLVVSGLFGVLFQTVPARQQKTAYFSRFFLPGGGLTWLQALRVSRGSRNAENSGSVSPRDTRSALATLQCQKEHGFYTVTQKIMYRAAPPKLLQSL